MENIHRLQHKQTVALLNKCWMSHDGMWFFHCLQEFGIETTNKLNKAAINSLASMEIHRIIKALGSTDPSKDFKAFKDFFKSAAILMIPEFMNVKFTYPMTNKVALAFTPGECFAYKGVKRLGAIAQYECGVLYRIDCWLNALGIAHQFTPGIGRCHMHHTGNCSGEIHLYFPN